VTALRHKLLTYGVAFAFVASVVAGAWLGLFIVAMLALLVRLEGRP
jgi:hypothetical protein